MKGNWPDPRSILVLNSGSSSLKYTLFAMEHEAVLAEGRVECIGETAGVAHHRFGQRGQERIELTFERVFADHRQAFDHLFELLSEHRLIHDAHGHFAIGHRVVHGGECFQQPALIDEAVVAAIRGNIPLAPLHNPSNLLGIEITRRLYPSIPQVAVFDTAFHQTLPEVAWRYAVPREWYEKYHIRRYGFHGTSHAYVAAEASRSLGHPLESLNLITLHLGNGASITAIREGRSIDTSMGMTPLEGLVMGTRSGDLDPSIVFYLERVWEMDSRQVEHFLNHESGLKGICGSNDMRAIHRAADGGDAWAKIAIALFCYRLRKYIGAYLAVLGKVDALVFTGGIGENDARIRDQVCDGLERLGIRLDASANERASRGGGAFHARDSLIALYVIPTDEELEIARQTLSIVRSLADSG